MLRWHVCFFAALLFIPVAAPATNAQEASPLFRLERQSISQRESLVTVFGKLPPPQQDIPLVSVLFEVEGTGDTLQARPRYVWSLTYEQPSLARRAAASVPFFYRGINWKEAEQSSAAHRSPPPVFDFQPSVWPTLAHGLWTLAQYTVLDDRGFLYRAAPRSYTQNITDYRLDHVHRALAIFYLLESDAEAQKLIPLAQLHELQAKLALATGLLGKVVRRDAIAQIAGERRSEWERARGHNWEMLRQRAEAEGLRFEPLALPDGTVTHALLWVVREDLRHPPAKKFDKRFLNIADPFHDARLNRSNGTAKVPVTETRWLDADDRVVAPHTAGAREVEQIPLAIYGLNHPRVPILLMDFRDGLNPKAREVSRRVLYDVTRNVFRFSPVRSFHWWAARKLFDVAMRHRGADIGQPSRLRAYAELDLLMLLNNTISPKLRAETLRQLPKLATSPMENNLTTELGLARANYTALLKDLRKQQEVGGK